MTPIIGAILITFMWMTLSESAEKGDVAKGKGIYANMCASCHGPGGKGDGPAAAALNPKPKDLTDKAYMKSLKDQYLSDIIAKGGAAAGKSPLMPPFGGALKEEDIRNLTAFMRSLAK
jgi:mono/diheme cytochrome c family protein